MNKAKKAIKIIREEGMTTFFKKSFGFFRGIFPLLIFPYFLIRIKRFNAKSIDELINFSFNRLGVLIEPGQVPEEISQLLKILQERKPKVILEVGTANGGTLFLFSKIVPEDTTIISVDLPGGRFGGGYPRWKIPLYKAFRSPKQKLYLVREDSHSQETLSKVKNILNGRKVDFLFIDADHTYEGVKKDFEMYNRLVERGVIALHDIVHHPKVPECQVEKFWKEIKRKYKTKEIIYSSTQGWGGIGVIFV